MSDSESPRHSKRKLDGESEDDAPALKAARHDQEADTVATTTTTTTTTTATPAPEWLKALEAVGPGNLGFYKGFGAQTNGVMSAKIGLANLKAPDGVDVTHFVVPPCYVSDVHLRGLGLPKLGDLKDAKYTFRGTWGAGLISDEMAAASPTLRSDTAAFMRFVKEARDKWFGFLFDREAATDDVIKRKIARLGRDEAFHDWVTGDKPPRHMGFFRGDGVNETMTVTFEVSSQWSKDKNAKIEPRRDVGNADHQALLDEVGPWGPKKRSNTPRFFAPDGSLLVNPATGRTFNADYEISEKNFPPPEEPLKDGDFVSFVTGFRLSVSDKGKSIKPIPKLDITLLKRDPRMAQKLIFNAPPPSDYAFGDPFATFSSSSSSSASSAAVAGEIFYEETLGEYGFD